MIGILSKSKVLGQGRSCKWIHVWSRWKDSNTYFQIFFHQRHLKPFSLFLFLFCESIFLRRNSNNNIKKNIHLSHWAPRTLTIKDSRQLLYPHNAPLPCPPPPTSRSLWHVSWSIVFTVCFPLQFKVPTDFFFLSSCGSLSCKVSTFMCAQMFCFCVCAWLCLLCQSVWLWLWCMWATWGPDTWGPDTVSVCGHLKRIARNSKNPSPKSWTQT